MLVHAGADLNRKQFGDHKGDRLPVTLNPDNRVQGEGTLLMMSTLRPLFKVRAIRDVKLVPEHPADRNPFRAVFGSEEVGYPDSLIVYRVNRYSRGIHIESVDNFSGAKEPAGANIRITVIPHAEPNLLGQGRAFRGKPHVAEHHVTMFVHLDRGPFIVDASVGWIVNLIPQAECSIDFCFAIAGVDAQRPD